MFKKTFCVVFLFGCARLFAQQHDHSTHSHFDDKPAAAHKHASVPPHGGIVKDLGKFHAEVLMDPLDIEEKLSVYILKSSLKQASVKGYSGTVTLIYSDTKSEVPMTNNGTDKLYINISDVSKPFKAVISIAYKGKDYVINYEYKGLGK